MLDSHTRMSEDVSEKANLNTNNKVPALRMPSNLSVTPHGDKRKESTKQLS